MATAVLHPQHCTSQIPFAPAHCPCSRSKPPRNSHRRRRRHEKNTGRRRKEKMMNPVVKEMGNIVRILKRDENLKENACSTDQATVVAQIAVRQEKIKAADHHHRFAGYVYTPPHPSSLPMPMMDLSQKKKKKKVDNDDTKTDCRRQLFSAVNIKDLWICRY